MTTFYLIRHGANDTVGWGIAGRREGVHLNSVGRAQAQGVAETLAHAEITALYCSPLERTRETAEPIAARLRLQPNALDGLLEVDFGEWTGRAFSALEQDPRWRDFNRARSVVRIPGGESMLEVQVRVVGALEGLRTTHPGERVAVVSHGDPIRTAIVHYGGIPLDLMHNIHIDIASVSVLAIDEGGAALRCLNHTGVRPTD